jgi:ABC-2 type transport system permease protein
VVHIPGFSAGSGNYLEFITPGVIVMTALFSSGWTGTVYIEDMNRGVMDRLLASPVRRGAMMASSLAYQGLTTVLQTLIVFAIAYASGARFSGAGVGIVVTVVAAVLISVIIASHVARYNPVDWAVVASRQALSAGTDWGAVWPRLGFLGLLALVMAWLATRAFGSYQRSM